MKFLFLLLLFLLVLSGLSSSNASVSQVKLYSNGTSHQFTVHVTTSNMEYTWQDLSVGCALSATHLFENNGKPYSVQVISKAWIDRSFFNYGWSDPTTRSVYNDMTTDDEDVDGDTVYDTIWNGGNLHLKFVNRR